VKGLVRTGAPRVFAAKPVTVGRTVGVQREFGARASWVFARKLLAICGATDVEGIRNTIGGTPGVSPTIVVAIWRAVWMEDVEAAGAAWVRACVPVAVGGTPSVERIPLTVGCTPRIFISKGGAVGRTMFAQRVFTAWTSRVFSGKEVTVGGTKDVERVD